MERLIISGRTNWKKGFYIKFKAEEKSMRIIKKIIEEMGSDYFVDNQAIPKTFSKYEKWKDQWIPVYSSKNKKLDKYVETKLFIWLLTNIQILNL